MGDCCRDTGDIREWRNGVILTFAKDNYREYSNEELVHIRELFNSVGIVSWGFDVVEFPCSRVEGLTIQLEDECCDTNLSKC